MWLGWWLLAAGAARSAEVRYSEVRRQAVELSKPPHYSTPEHQLPLRCVCLILCLSCARLSRASIACRHCRWRRGVIIHLPSSRRVLASKFRDVLQPLKTVTNDFYRTLPLAGYDVVTRTAVLTSVAQAADEMVHSDAEIVAGAQCITQKRPDNWVRNGEKVRELRLSPERLSP